MTRPPFIDVAVGVLVRADGAVLLADRPAGKAYAGYWEFPGGKIETGETVADALARELHEELGVTIRESFAWVVYEHVYPHAHVRLNFRRVFDWTGEPHAREGQRLLFLARGATPPHPLLPAAQPALRWLGLPPVLSIAPARTADGTLAVGSARGILVGSEDRRSLEDITAAAAEAGNDFVVLDRPLPEHELVGVRQPLYAIVQVADDAAEGASRRLGLHGVAVY